MNTTNNMQYGVIYTKVCPERSAARLKHYHILSSTQLMVILTKKVEY
jgi:hypothetical protein